MFKMVNIVISSVFFLSHWALIVKTFVSWICWRVGWYVDMLKSWLLCLMSWLIYWWIGWYVDGFVDKLMSWLICWRVGWYVNVVVFVFVFLAFDFLSVLRGHSFFFIPATTANDLRLQRIFYPRFYPLHLFSYLNSWERASIFPFECSVLNKGTTGTIFITSLVWRGPWLGIEPGTSSTRSQHYTTRLSRRRYFQTVINTNLSL